MVRRLYVVLLLAVQTACASFAGDAAKEAAAQGAPVAITESLRTLETPENRKLIQQFFAMPEVREASRRLGASVTDGALASVAGRLDGMKIEGNAEGVGRDLSRGFVLGMDDALRELEAKQVQGKPTGLVGRFSKAADTGLQLTTIAVIVLGVLFMALAVWVVRLTLEERRHQVDTERREAAMTAMVEAIRRTESHGWSPELRRVVETQLPGTDSRPPSGGGGSPSSTH